MPRSILLDANGAGGVAALYGCTGTGYGQLENSYIYLALTLTSLASTSVIGWASKRWSDRNLLCCFQIISWSGLITYTLSSGLGQFAHDGCTLYAVCSQPQSRLDLERYCNGRNMTSFSGRSRLKGAVSGVVCSLAGLVCVWE